MSTTYARFLLVLAEAQLSQTRANHFGTRIASGVYKTRKCRMGGHDGPLLTEEELLQDEINTQASHLHRAQECIDFSKELLSELQEEERHEAVLKRKNGY